MSTPQQTSAPPSPNAVESGRIGQPLSHAGRHRAGVQVATETTIPAPGNWNPPADSTSGGAARRPRSTPSQEAPFAWQAKAALRRIVRSERVSHRGHALAVYVLLSLLISDKEANSVSCTKGFLSSQAGLGARTVAQALLDLEALGLVEIKRTKLPGTAANAVNTYTLTSCTNCTTSCKGRSPSRARNKNNPSRPEGSLKGEERNLNPPAAAAASTCAPAQQPGATKPVASAFVMSGLDD
jgi:hypothetical protein